MRSDIKRENLLKTRSQNKREKTEGNPCKCENSTLELLRNPRRSPFSQATPAGLSFSVGWCCLSPFRGESGSRDVVDIHTPMCCSKKGKFRPQEMPGSFFLWPSVPASVCFFFSAWTLAGAKILIVKAHRQYQEIPE